jgi:hypothetical protein
VAPTGSIDCVTQRTAPSQKSAGDCRRKPADECGRRSVEVFEFGSRTGCVKFQLPVPAARPPGHTQSRWRDKPSSSFLGISPLRSRTRAETWSAVGLRRKARGVASRLASGPPGHAGGRSRTTRIIDGALPGLHFQHLPGDRRRVRAAAPTGPPRHSSRRRADLLLLPWRAQQILDTQARTANSQTAERPLSAQHSCKTGGDAGRKFSINECRPPRNPAGRAGVRLGFRRDSPPGWAASHRFPIAWVYKSCQ